MKSSILNNALVLSQNSAFWNKLIAFKPMDFGLLKIANVMDTTVRGKLSAVLMKFGCGPIVPVKRSNIAIIIA
jgi:hypothetical protein